MNGLTRTFAFPALCSLCLAIAGMASVTYIAGVEKSRVHVEQLNQVVREAAIIRSNLERELNFTRQITTAVLDDLAASEKVGGEKVSLLLPILYRSGRNVRSIMVAPENRIGLIYPPGGKERLIGLTLQGIPEYSHCIQPATDTRQSVHDGSYRLVREGAGIIDCIPVVFPTGQYWGMLSIALDEASLFGNAGLVAVSNGVRMAVLSKNGLGLQGGMIFGDAAVFEQQPYMLSIDVPGDEWVLGAVPERGWRQVPGSIEFYRYAGYFIAGLLALLLFRFLRSHSQMQHLAMHDNLTGLPNRRLFHDRVERSIASAQRHRDKFALLYIDLNKFKPINDRYGHKVGDKVLLEVARRLLGEVRQNDTVARIGGDEFTVILMDIHDAQFAVQVANKVLDALRADCIIDGQQIDVDASIGVSVFPEDGHDMDTLVRVADKAMYSVKDGRLGQVSHIRGNNVPDWNI